MNEENKKSLPLNITLLVAKNAIRNALSNITAQYNLNATIVDLLLESILADERQGHLAMLSEQYVVSHEEDKPQSERRE